MTDMSLLRLVAVPVDIFADGRGCIGVAGEKPADALLQELIPVVFVAREADFMPAVGSKVETWYFGGKAVYHRGDVVFEHNGVRYQVSSTLACDDPEEDEDFPEIAPDPYKFSLHDFSDGKGRMGIKSALSSVICNDVQQEIFYRLRKHGYALRWVKA